MRQRLQAFTDANGIPYAKVPCQSMWDLVEYLSYQRVTVSYHYAATHFTVTFLRKDVRSAQAILDGWAASEGVPSEMLQSA